MGKLTERQRVELKEQILLSPPRSGSKLARRYQVSPQYVWRYRERLYRMRLNEEGTGYVGWTQQERRPFLVEAEELLRVLDEASEIDGFPPELAKRIHLDSRNWESCLDMGYPWIRYLECREGEEGKLMDN